MERKLERVPVMIVTAAGAVVAYLLRSIQLATQIDATGSFVVGAGKGPLTWIALILILASAGYAFLLSSREEMPCSSLPAMILTLAAAFFTALGSISAWKLSPVVALGCVGTAVCWVILALRRQQGAQPHALLFMIPALFTAVELIIKFRDWSRDPLLLDYCFELFAAIFIMFATYHLGGFSLGRAHLRRSVFYCMGGIMFSAVAVAGSSLLTAMPLVGAMLWLMANLWLLLSEAE